MKEVGYLPGRLVQVFLHNVHWILSSKRLLQVLLDVDTLNLDPQVTLASITDARRRLLSGKS